MADHLEASVTLPSDPASVAAARTYAVGTLAEWGLPADADLSETVRLVVSE
ncbi:ATP-binding protein, partial [Streptomyces sp. SID6648]|nr:ATP-binding protein [Streptomyces sp. SID6648]